jgi:sugar lactone lactonase YvrE
VQRWLTVRAVIVVTFVAFSVLAVAQKSSVATISAHDQSTEVAYAKPEKALDGIKADKPVVIIATGIAPRALAIDPRANIFVTNGAAPNRIFTLTGLADLATGGLNPGATARLAWIAGSGISGSLGDGGNALGAQFALKLDSLVMRSGIAVAADGTIVVADTLNATIRRIAGSDSTEPGIVRSIAGQWASRQNIAMAEPLGLALDHAGNLYVADRAAGAIDVLPDAVTSSPGDQHVQVLAHVAAPASIALTNDGNKAFVASADSGAIFEIDTQTRAIRSLAALPALKNAANGETLTACANAQANGSGPLCPAGLAADGGANLFVADANSGNILRLDARTSQLTTAASGLHSPGDMSFDSSGNLFVAEQGANRILKFVSMGQDPSNLTITMPPALPPPPSPRVCPQTAPFDFCDQPTGGSTPTQPFTVTNNTSAAVGGIAISFTGANPGDFQPASNTCGSSLAAGATCTINVDFAPTATGSRSATLSVTDAAGDSTTASVTGTGDDYQITLNGSPIEQSVVQGGTVKFNFNVAPDTVFGGDVTIVCPANIPSLSTCTPSSSTVTVTPGTPAQFSMTFVTTYNGVLGGSASNGLVPGARIPHDRGNRSAFGTTFSPAILLAVFSSLGLAFSWSRFSKIARLRRASLLWIAVLLFTCGVAFLGGCKHHSVPANLNTPAGATTLIVQGTAQNASRGITIILDVVGPG